MEAASPSTGITFKDCRGVEGWVDLAAQASNSEAFGEKKTKVEERPLSLSQNMKLCGPGEKAYIALARCESSLYHNPTSGARAPLLCPAVRPRVRLGPSISHRPVAVGTAEGGCVRRPSCKLYRGPGMELPDPVRQRLGNFSRTVFSDSNRTGPEYSEGPGEWARPSAAAMACGGFGADNEMVSSLALQMSLYFNTYFFPLWWVSSIMMLQMKYSILPDYYKFIVVTVIILITLIEAIRLYLGYMGNLQEKLPLILFLLFNEGLTNLPLEKAIHIIFTLFLTFQVVSAFLTLRKMVNQLATRFHLQDFDRLSAYRGGMTRGCSQLTSQKQELEHYDLPWSQIPKNTFGVSFVSKEN
ncbi:hypothetical protein GH733_009263 [Mirounga leonina]|nr:hypothetical protein GH733_009263 [Mirounga leonina]